MECEYGKYCEEFHRVLAGRLWDIYKGVNIDPAYREKLLDQWRKGASQPVAAPAKAGCGGCGAARRQELLAKKKV